jgi:hypothetical protein
MVTVNMAMTPTNGMLLSNIKFDIGSPRYIDLYRSIGLPAVLEFNMPEW